MSTQFSWNIPVSAPKGLIRYWNMPKCRICKLESHLNLQKYSRRTRSVPWLLISCFVQNFKIIWLLSKKLRVVEILQDFDFKMSFQDFLNYIGPLGTIGANWKLRDGIKTQLEFFYWNNLLVTVQAIKIVYCFVLVHFVLVIVTVFFMDSCNLFIHNPVVCFHFPGAMAWMHHWSNFEGLGIR